MKKTIKLVLVAFMITLLVACGSKKVDTSEKDLKEFYSNIYLEKELNLDKTKAYKFKNDYTKKISQELVSEFSDVSDDNEYIELIKEAQLNMLNSVEIKQGEITNKKVDKETIYSVSLYIAPVDFSYYTINYNMEAIEIFQQIVMSFYPDMDGIAQSKLALELMEGTTTFLETKDGDKLFIKDLTTYYSSVMSAQELAEDEDMTLTNSSNNKNQVMFEVPIKFKYNKDNKFTIVSLDGEAVDGNKEAASSIRKNVNTFKLSQDITAEKKKNKDNFDKDGNFKEELIYVKETK